MTDWAAYAASFKSTRELAPEAMREWMRRITEVTGVTPAELPGGPWLDVGAGVGRFCAVLRSYWDRDIVALEPQAEMVARREMRSGVEWVRGSALAPPVLRGRCAGVWVHLVLHQIPTWARAVEQLADCLAPGGVLAIRTLNPSLDTRPILHELFPQLSTLEVRWPAPTAIAASVSATGLQPVSRDYAQERLVPRDAFVQSIEGKAFSSLHRLSPAAFAAGVERVHARFPPGSPPIRQTERSTLIAAVR